uniref:NB-ARC domain-containing protein n=1 Tax=Corethron hystrix TaxID=216773 RepID=A0A7S1FMA3_9STRA
MDPMLLPRYELLISIAKFIEDTKVVVNNTTIDGGLSNSGVKRLTLRGMGGLGKTTLAAMAVNLASVRAEYDHILWLNLGNHFQNFSDQNNINFDMYIGCLQNLCRQLGVSADHFHSELFLQPGDRPYAVASKTAQAIEESKCRMSQIINGLKVLIVLDDVWNHEDAELFNFGEQMTSCFCMLLTTRTLDQELLGSHILNVNFLNHQEATNLFCIEAGLSESFSTEDMEPLNNIIRKCGYVPLAIRTAGKIMKNIRQEIQPNITFTEIALMFTSSSDSPKMDTVFAILDRSFEFVRNSSEAHILRLFVSAFASLFHKDDSFRPWITSDGFALLWKSFTDSEIMNEFCPHWLNLGSENWQEISNLMCKMGLFDEDYVKYPRKPGLQKYFRIHHDLIWEFGKRLSSLFRVSNGKLVRCVEHGKTFCPKCFNSESDAEFISNSTEWAKMITESYSLSSQPNASENCDNSNLAINYESYMLEWFPLHLIKRGQSEEAVKLMKNEDFFMKQLRTFGIWNSCHMAVACVRTYSKSFFQNMASMNSSKGSKLVMVDVLFFVRDILNSFHRASQLKNIDQKEIGCSFIMLGVELQKYSRWIECFDFFFMSLNVFRSIGYGSNHPDIVRATRCIESCSLSPVILVSKDSPSRLRLKDHNTIFQKDKGKASFPLELSSHPGYAIARMNENYTKVSTHDQSWDYVMLGLGLKNSALVVSYDEGLIMHDNRMFRVSLDHFEEGTPITLRSPTKMKDTNELHSPIQMKDTNEEPEQVSNFLPCLNSSAQSFSIAFDGTIYPTMAPHLCLGVSPYPHLVLVSKNSPCRAIFKNFSDLQSLYKIPKKNAHSIERDQLEEQCNVDDGIKLELASHPGMGVVHIFGKKMQTSIASVHIDFLGLGPLKNAISAKMTEKGEILFQGKCEGVLCPSSPTPEIGDILLVLNVNPFSDGTDNETYKFIVHDNGTISPMLYPSLVLGFQVVHKEYSK